MPHLAILRQMIGDGICMILLKDQIGSLTRMLLNLCAKMQYLLYVNLNKWAYHFHAWRMAKYTRECMGGNLLILAKVNMYIEHAQQRTVPVMQFCIRFIKKH